MIKSLLPFLLLLIFFVGCKSDPEVVEDNVQRELPNLWVDSLVGELTEQEQLMQHLIVEIPASYQPKSDSLVQWIIAQQPGYISFQNWNLDSISLIKNQLDTCDIIQPAYHANFNEMLGLDHYNYWEASSLNQSFDLWSVFAKGGFGLVDLPKSNHQNISQSLADSIYDNLGVNICKNTFEDKFAATDFNDFLTNLNKSQLNINLDIFNYDSVDFNGFRTTTKFEGLFIAKTQLSNLPSFLDAGLDLMKVPIEKLSVINSLNFQEPSKHIESLKRILDQKSKLDRSKQNLKSEMRYAQLNFAHNSVAILSNSDQLIPIQKKVVFHAESNHRVSQKIRKENRLSVDKHPIDLEHFNPSSTKIDIYLIADSLSVEFANKLKNIASEDQTIICFQHPEQYEQLKACRNLVFIPTYKGFKADIFIQQLAGRITIPATAFASSPIVETKPQEAFKLARTIPEFVGYDPDTLNQINWFVNNAMNGKAFPGCQVLLAKNGCIIYDKQFGHHSYQRQKVVTDESIYDLASITKVLATTLVGMKLYEMEQYELDDSLELYLPDSLSDYLPYPSTIRNITFQELYTHMSGLPAGFPILHYMLYTNEEVGRYDKYYCDQKDTTFCIEVAENLFLDKEYADSMWFKLNQIWLDKSKPYKYSDVSMNTLYMMFKSMIDNQPKTFDFNQSEDELVELNLFEEYLYKTYYKPLGMERTMYKPRRKFAVNSIVPTEDEAYWRKQLLQGYVHDPNAALMGGIAGNAGLFSTTNDMVILCQMLLNKGIYNQQRFLNEETVTKFTSAQPQSHRGLGFNKKAITTSGYGMADSCSLLTYGHTGFTGTCFWIDPAEDLIYIFLSNRVHPKVNNRIYNYRIRKRIHNTAFAARMNIKDF